MNILPNAMNLLDKFLRGADPIIHFKFYYQEFNKTVDQLSVAIDFTGLVDSKDFNNEIQIAFYPRVDGKISMSGMFKDEGASCTLIVARQYDYTMTEDEIAKADNELYNALNTIKYDPRNLYIPVQANLPFDLVNYRIINDVAIDRDKYGFTQYTISMIQVPVTDWNNAYMQQFVTRPEYEQSQNQGQAKTTTDKTEFAK